MQSRACKSATQLSFGEAEKNMYKYSFDVKQNCVIAEFSGDIYIEDYERFLCELSASKEIERSPKILIDQRKGQMVISHGKVEGHSHFVSEMEKDIGRSKVAVVVGSDRDYEMNKMFEKASENTRISEGKIFRDINEAKQWLGIS